MGDKQFQTDWFKRKKKYTSVYFGKAMKKDWVYNKIPVDLLIAKCTIMYSLISLYRL